LNVYLVRDNDNERIVEAVDFGEAIAIYKAWVIAENGPDDMECWQPHNVQLLSDDPVLRVKP